MMSNWDSWKYRKATMSIALTSCLVSVIVVPFYALATVSSAGPVAPPTASGGKNLTVTLPMLGDTQGYRLKTVRTQRDYYFTRPKGWKILPGSVIHLTFQHGHNLLPERSSLNVLINNRILKSIPLSVANVTPNSVDIPVPPELLQDRNSLSFQVDQHYTYKCEDPFSEELWTELLPDTKLSLHYALQGVSPNLSQYPFPVLDELNTYYPTVVSYLIPTGSGAQVSDQTLEAFGVVATHLGQQARWHALKGYVGNVNAPNNNDNQVVVGTPTENPALSRLISVLPLKISGGQFVDTQGIPLPADVGILEFVPNPSNLAKAVLIVSGNGPEGVRKAAHILAQNSLNKILTGRYAIIKDYAKGADYPARAWDGFVLKSGDNLANLGLETQTTRGITGLPLFYSLKVMPDIYLPGHQKAKLHTYYSYASQLDGSQSKLEVLLNGKAIKSVPLDDKAGKSLAELNVEIPTEEIHTFNDLEYRFHLYPEKYDMCRFVTDVHIWGTVHNTSWFELPGEIKTAIPDVGLVNDAGFPFSEYQDFSHVGYALPDSVEPSDLEAMLQIASRLGRESASHKGIELIAHHVSTVPDNQKGAKHWIVIGRRGHNKWLDEVKGKASLLMENGWNHLQDPQKTKVAQINYTAGQGIVEELLSPWNDKQVLLFLTGENETALSHDAQLFQNQDWFSTIKMGNIVVVNDNGPQSLLFLQKREARFLQSNTAESGNSNSIPPWIWIPLGLLSLLGLGSIFRFFSGR